jgi:hypothetical protein
VRSAARPSDESFEVSRGSGGSGTARAGSTTAAVTPGCLVEMGATLGAAAAAAAAAAALLVGTGDDTGSLGRFCSACQG